MILSEILSKPTKIMCHPTNSPLFFVPSVEINGGDKYLQDKDPNILRAALLDKGFDCRSKGKIDEFRRDLLPLKGVVLVASNDLWIRESFQGIVSEALRSNMKVSPLPIFALSTPNDPLYNYLEQLSRSNPFRGLVTLCQVTDNFPLEYYRSRLIFWAEECAKTMVPA